MEYTVAFEDVIENLIQFQMEPHWKDNLRMSGTLQYKQH
jgi:hypothetical protein